MIYAPRLELLRFHGSASWRVTVIPMIDLNRNLAVGFTFSQVVLVTDERD